uniref:Uncharacterized protein n=1 Tax=Solanum lycopersicum TaxID=4081 RepID=A0A3Q7EPJ8_SOLLC
WRVLQLQIEVWILTFALQVLTGLKNVLCWQYKQMFNLNNEKKTEMKKKKPFFTPF